MTEEERNLLDWQQDRTTPLVYVSGMGWIPDDPENLRDCD